MTAYEYTRVNVSGKLDGPILAAVLTLLLKTGEACLKPFDSFVMYFLVAALNLIQIVVQ